MNSVEEDVYELSPMQQGMLYHSVTAPQSGMYCIQVSYTLTGPLDIPAFARAWQAVVDRHAVLRTSFRWDRATPVQIVHPRADLQVIEEDWRSSPADVQEVRLQRLLQAESDRGFDLTHAPLMRVTIVRSGQDVHHLVLAHHHLLLDGWCKPLLFQEVFAFYEAFRQGRALELPPPPPYRAFIEWLRTQDLAMAERFWRNELAGFAAPTPLWPEGARSPQQLAAFEEHHLELDLEASDAIRVFARQHRLTLNTIVTSMWALLLAHSSATDDVVFGATVHGRPADLEDSDSILGLFINTLPVRVQVPPSVGIVPWMQTRQAHQAALRDYDFCPLSHVQRWSAVPAGHPLFESIVVFENNVGFGCDREQFGAIEMSNVRALIKNGMPLTLRCVPARQLACQLLYDSSRFSLDTIQWIATQLTVALRALPQAAAGSVETLLRELKQMQRERETAQTSALAQTVLSKLRTARQARSIPR